jgi:hypothetical protein
MPCPFSVDKSDMEPNEKVMYEMLKKIIPLLSGRTPILYGGGSDKEQQFTFQYLAKEGYNRVALKRLLRQRQSHRCVPSFGLRRISSS